MKLPNAAVERVVSRMEKARLGDARRSARLPRVLKKLARNPSGTFPEVMGSEADIEAGYRFVKNRAISMKALNEAHAKHTARRAKELQRPVLAIHDTTSCRFGRARPEDIGYLHTGNAGFKLHMTLIADTEGPRRPIGITHVEPIVRPTPPPKTRKKKKKKERRPNGGETTKKENRESLKWWRGIEETERQLTCGNIIHIGDRESDAYELMARCVGAHYRFVFRVRVPERRARGRSGDWETLKTVAEQCKVAGTRDVILSARERAQLPQSRVAHPERASRNATLEFAATSVEIPRPKYASKTLPVAIRVNLIRVIERNPPPGEEPVEWLLFTSEPISAKRKIEGAIDYYRARWLIEELHKALKTGCAYEDRQFESRDALLTVLALSLPIACEILWLRSRARDAPDTRAIDVFTPLQIELLRRVGSRTLPKHPTTREALLALAALGGHLRSNGEPGYQVLQRALVKLHALEAGWEAREALKK